MHGFITCYINYIFMPIVPLKPTGFNTSMKHDNSLDTIVTFQWNPPQGSGPETIVDSYKISITPRPVSHPVLNVVSYTTSWNVTLYFNVEYSATIIAVNCAGDSSPFTLHDIKFSEFVMYTYFMLCFYLIMQLTAMSQLPPEMDTL